MELRGLVRDYVHAHHATVGADYRWRLDEKKLAAVLGITLTSSDGLAKEFEFKRAIAELWATSDRAGRERIAHYCVVVWGGILRTSAASLARYVDAAERDEPPPLDGISSWSKVFTAANPTRHAIFDARVAASLNALQLRQPAGYVVQLFPTLTSRNSTVVRAEPLIRRLASQRECAPVAKPLVYSTYLSLLEHAAEGLDTQLPLATAEMVLFAYAERLVLGLEQTRT